MCCRTLKLKGDSKLYLPYFRSHYDVGKVKLKVAWLQHRIIIPGHFASIVHNGQVYSHRVDLNMRELILISEKRYESKLRFTVSCLCM
jgi:hypothetical protein